MEKKKPKCTEMQSICVRNAARLLLCWAVLLQKATLVPVSFHSVVIWLIDYQVVHFLLCRKGGFYSK